jgi:formate-dependent nitrite reductase membrane component NrfD
MTEVDVTGVNPIDYPELTTWGWPVVAYLFLGGLVGGLMILTAVLRWRRDETWARAIRIADLWALPLLALGLFLLFLDLSYKVHAWRFFLAFEPTSAMSWGSWILVVAAVVLALRAYLQLPATTWFASRTPMWIRTPVTAAASFLEPRVRWLDGASIVVGTALALYTGILLSTIPARPLWDSVVLAPLFLVSGVAAAGAFVGLFLSPAAHRRLTPTSMGLCAAELTLIVAFLASLALGTPATRRAAEMLLSWPYGTFFWVVVVVAGLLLPFTIEAMEMRHFTVPGMLSRSAPLLKLTGSAGLRFVIVLAGLQTVM